MIYFLSICKTIYGPVKAGLPTSELKMFQSTFLDLSSIQKSASGQQM